jgi:hypothetical protein
MRALPILLLALLVPVAAQVSPAAAQPKPAAKPPAAAAPAPKPIGAFEEWQAATYDEGGQTVCYAFTKARTSSQKLPGRGEIILTVTQRVAMRDAVSISAGFEYPTNASVDVQSDKGKFEFYTAKRSAFARDGHAVIAALSASRQVTAKSPHPQKKEVIDTFGLKGFAKAYEAINKACPPK